MNNILNDLSIKFETISKKAYLVGGAVRDEFLSLPIKEFDYVTDASLQEIDNIFPNSDFSFSKFGYVKIYYQDNCYDLSLLRKEEYYQSIRHPSKIEFVSSLEEDSWRRDFTINALYKDRNGKVYDFHNGIIDLNKHVIRMIGNIEQRIKEDPLRILRALRFKIQLNFEIERELDIFIKNNLELITILSRYQIQHELEKMKSLSETRFSEIVKEYHLDEVIVVEDIKRKYSIIDLHCDTITKLYQTKKNLIKNDCHIDVNKLIKGQYLLQCFAIFLHQKKENVYEMFDKYYDFYKKEVESNSLYLKEVLSYNDLIKTKSENKIGCLLSIEEGEVLNNNILKLEELYKKGVRMITLTWNYPNCLGTGNINLNNEIEDFQKLKPNVNEGLTEFGKKVVKRMNELGMIIDVSHLSDKGFFDVIEISSQPIVASHSNSRKIQNVIRNLTDEMILAIHQNKGVVGINYCSDFISDNKGNQIKDIVRHIQHFKELGCLDNVALGSDFDGIDTPNGLDDCSKMSLLYESLISEGFSMNEIQKIFFKNFIRVLKIVLK